MLTSPITMQLHSVYISNERTETRLSGKKTLSMETRGPRSNTILVDMPTIRPSPPIPSPCAPPPPRSRPWGVNNFLVAGGSRRGSWGHVFGAAAWELLFPRRNTAQLASITLRAVIHNTKWNKGFDTIASLLRLGERLSQQWFLNEDCLRKGCMKMQIKYKWQWFQAFQFECFTTLIIKPNDVIRLRYSNIQIVLKILLIRRKCVKFIIQH